MATKTEDAPPTKTNAAPDPADKPAEDAAPAPRQIVRLSPTRLNQAEIKLNSLIAALGRVDHALAEMLFGRHDSTAPHVIAMRDAAVKLVDTSSAVQDAHDAVTAAQKAMRDFA